MNTQQRMSETNRLHNILHNTLASLRVSRRHPPGSKPIDSIDGWDEMQGYPETYGYGNGAPTVGLSWGDIGHGLNLAVNPVAQYHFLQRHLGGGGGQARPPMPRMPPPMPMAPQIPLNQTQAFANQPARLLSYMGIGSLSWVSTDTQTEKPMEAEPQAAFRGRRLVIAQAKSAGAVGVLVTLTSPLNVSGMPQTPAPDSPAPVEMFEAATTYSMLDLQIAVSGTKITLGISVSHIPASGETVSVAAGLYGEWLR
jgi:hypothetical protein